MFICQVRATDRNLKNFTDDTDVEIIVLDKNDNSPIFTKDDYYFNLTSGAEIGQVHVIGSL